MAGTVYNCRLTLTTGSGEGGGDTEPVYLDATTLREPEKQIAETKLRDTEEARTFFMPILGRQVSHRVQPLLGRKLTESSRS